MANLLKMAISESIRTLHRRGWSQRRIAAELHLGIKTVESYRARIKDKLKLDDGTQLLQHAIQWVHSLQDR